MNDNIRSVEDDVRSEGKPELRLEITKDNYERAIKASSGACLVADAIKEKYPKLALVKVDVATIRVTDRERGERYIYLTPPSVAEMLLFFDQGWREAENSLPRKLRIRHPVKIIPITRSASSVKATAKRQEARLAELESKQQSGGALTGLEQRSLEKLRNRKEAVNRPTTYGPAKAEGTGENITIRGGVPPKHHKHNPNLLHGRTRHFGAKTAQPSEVFRQAVKEAVKADRVKRRRRQK